MIYTKNEVERNSKLNHSGESGMIYIIEREISVNYFTFEIYGKEVTNYFESKINFIKSNLCQRDSKQNSDINYEMLIFNINYYHEERLYLKQDYIYSLNCSKRELFPKLQKIISNDKTIIWKKMIDIQALHNAIHFSNQMLSIFHYDMTKMYKQNNIANFDKYKELEQHYEKLLILIRRLSINQLNFGEMIGINVSKEEIKLFFKEKILYYLQDLYTKSVTYYQEFDLRIYLEQKKKEEEELERQNNIKKFIERMSNTDIWILDVMNEDYENQKINKRQKTISPIGWNKSVYSKSNTSKNSNSSSDMNDVPMEQPFYHMGLLFPINEEDQIKNSVDTEEYKSIFKKCRYCFKIMKIGVKS
jgi:hypothetical protein